MDKGYIYTYDGNDETVCIPSHINGHPVVKIGGYAFAFNNSIRSVVIPEGVREIEWSAFENCSALQSVVIPESVTVIGKRAFADCCSLQSVEIPAGVATIEKETFENCSTLSSIVLHEGLERIWCNAFENCTSLVQVVLPDSVEYIGDDAFFGCSGLKNCNIPNGIVYMGYRVFEGCDDLVLSITPGNFREAYAERYHLPFISSEDSSSSFIKRSPAGKVMDIIYKLSTNYEHYHQVAGELPAMDVMMKEERSGSWEKEAGRWVLHEGFAQTIWTFDFQQDYVWRHLEEALLRALFHPNAEIEFPWKTLTLVCEDIFFQSKNFPQLKLRRDYTVLRRNPEPRYGAITTWIAVSDSQIAVMEEFLYD